MAAYIAKIVSSTEDLLLRSLGWQQTLPWTTACSPKTMTLPGAETIKGGIIGVDFLRANLGASLALDDLLPLLLL
jgi:hypothetical protein